MTRLDGRMDRMLETLTVGERAAHSLRRWKEGRHPDRMLAATLPEEERREFQEILGMVRVANGEVALLLLGLESRVQCVERTLGWLESLEVMRFVLLTCSESRLNAAARDAVDTGSLFLGGLDDAFSGGARAKAAELVVSELRATWLELRAIEVALAGLQSALRGEDPLAETHRARLSGCRERLAAVHEEVQELVGEIALPEPDRDQQERATELLKAG